MKIESFERVGDEVTAILEDGFRVVLGWDYIVEKKPQVGDEFEVVEPVIETK
jgi:hypothetical protein